MIASAKKMSERESLIRRFEKQAAHDAIHFSPAVQPNLDYVDADSTNTDWVLFQPHARTSNAKPISAAKMASPAKPKVRPLLRRPKAAASDNSSGPQAPAAACPGKPAEERKPVEAPDPITRLQELVALAKYGDTEALESIRQELDGNPALWQAVGDLAALSEAFLISVIAAGNALVSESMEREIERLKSELAEGTTPTPLERLAIQRIVACWLHAQYTDRATLAADATGSKIAAWGKRQEAAERRFQSAIKSLDLVRRLAPKRGLAKATTIGTIRPTQGTAIPHELKGAPPAPSEPRKQPIVNGSASHPTPPNNRIRRFVRQEVPAT